MSNVYVHFSQISFSVRYLVINFQLKFHSLRFREVMVVCHSYFLQSELIERAEKSPLIFPKEKTRGLNALNFNFLLSFLVLLGFWLCVCLQRSGLCPTSPRLHARKVRQKRLPVSAPVHYPTAKAGRLSACPP